MYSLTRILIASIMDSSTKFRMTDPASESVSEPAQIEPLNDLSGKMDRTRRSWTIQNVETFHEGRGGSWDLRYPGSGIFAEYMDMKMQKPLGISTV